MKKTIIIVILVLLAGYFLLKDKKMDKGGDDVSNTTPIPTEIVTKVKAFAAKEYKIKAEDITGGIAATSEWSDGCLGLGGPAESCIQAITPGYNVIVEFGGKSHTFRTDSSATQIREAK